MRYFDVFPLSQGFVAMCLIGVSLTVVIVGAVETCPGELCDGMYGVNCPCVRVAQLPRHAVSITVVIDIDDASFSDKLGLDIQPYVSVKLTEAMIDVAKLEVGLITAILNEHKINIYNMRTFLKNIERVLTL